MASDPNFLIAEHRFGYGPHAGKQVFPADSADYLLSQLNRATIPSELNTGKKGMQLLIKYRELHKEKKEATTGDEEKTQAALQDLNKDIIANYLSDIDARMELIASTDTPFYERLAWFWNNHFTVSGTKHHVIPLLGAYDAQAIRPYITGYFSDLLRHAIQHPAMILYLDNQLSISPDKGVLLGQVRLFRTKNDMPNAPTGINENLAREIMELHTLGPDGGYTQRDVTNFAHVLTGWTVDMDSDMGFKFGPRRHDDTPQMIMGKVYGRSGIAQGEDVLDDLAHHPATAKHISFKLAQHFVADDPPDALVERLSASFINSKGHLPTVYRTLVESPEAWQAPFSKAKTPFDYLGSLMRLFPQAHPEPKKLVGALDQMGQKPWFAPSPKGWPDRSENWLTPDGLWKRVEVASLVGDKTGEKLDARLLAEKLYGPYLSNTTRTALTRAESKNQAMSLLLLSPEFQRR